MQTRIQLSHNQVVNMLAIGGHKKSRIIVGHMGSGKSATLKDLAARLPNHVPCYVDCTILDVGDVQIPAVDHATRTVSFYPNSIFGVHLDRPVIIMLDEFGKAARPVQNALLPMLQEKRIGAFPLHPDSVVYATTNLGGEGVGDTEQPHARNRRSEIFMRKPSGEEWLHWGLNNGIHEAVLGFVRETPQLFQSYEEVTNPVDNQYIFHPKEQRRSFVTPRSLESASHTVHDRELLNDDDITHADLCGTIGQRAASDLMSYILLADKLPRHASVVADPATALLPADSPAAMVMVVDRSVARVTKEELDNVLTYVCRLPREMQALFCTLLMQSNKGTFAAKNRLFSEWADKNSWLLRG